MLSSTVVALGIRAGRSSAVQYNRGAVTPKHCPELFQGTTHPHLRGCRGNAQSPRDLLVAEFTKDAKGNNLTQRFRKMRDRARQVVASLESFEVRRLHVVDGEAFGVGKAAFSTPTLASQAGERGANRDLSQPTTKAALAIMGERPRKPRKDIVQRVLGIPS